MRKKICIVIVLLVLCAGVSGAFATTSVVHAKRFTASGYDEGGIASSTMIQTGKNTLFLYPQYYRTAILGLSGTSAYRTLITWDLSNLPQEAQVTSATLTVRGAQSPRAGSPDTAEIYRLLKPFDPYNATWFKRTINDNWDTPGIGAVSDAASDGGAYDRAETPLDSVILLAVSSADTATIAAPAKWFGGTNTNSLIRSAVSDTYQSHTGNIGYILENGIARTLVTWDLSNLPAGIGVVSANLNLTAGY